MNLNQVDVSVCIAGKSIVFSQMKLHQKMNSHHHCEILLDYDAFGDKTWMAEPVKTIKYIGESLSITMTHAVTGESTVFSGLVSNISFTGYHGMNNHIKISGVSETIKLAGMPHMDSFVNKTLEEIAIEAITNSGSGAACKVKTEYNKPIDYQMQYNESCFDFLNRLSYLYGESFYSPDGSEVFFGKIAPQDPIDITYDIEVTEFNLDANLIPPVFKHYNYLPYYHQEWQKETRSDVPDAAGYLHPALNKSEMIYTSQTNTSLGALVHDSDSLLKMIDIERTRNVANMLILHCKTQTCKIGLGKVVTVSFPANLPMSTSAGAFIVTEVTFQVDKGGAFSSAFSGVRAALGYIPVHDVKLPVTAPQRATVSDNADPEGKGRIKVQMQFQKYCDKETNWIRAISPDAGGTAHVTKNRGYVFIPETGDDVMIQFEDNNPARPYCAGSLFPETVGKGGGLDNHLKSIKTRSGHTIELDDSDNAETIRIKDRNANEILYDTQSKTITISTLEQINLVSKTIRIDTSEDFIVSVGRDMQQSVGNNFTHATSGESRISVGKSSVTNVENDYEVTANRNIEMESGKNTTTIVGGKLRQDVENNIDITSVAGKTSISSKGKIEVKSNDKVNIK